MPEPSARHVPHLAGTPDMSCDCQRGLGLEDEVVDQDALVDAVLGLEVDDGIPVAEWDESVSGCAVGLAHHVTIAVAVAEDRNNLRLGIAVGDECLDRA